jgi:tetratricopeptide (TPR) repeat protein
MANPSASSTVEVQVRRIRELSKTGHHREALDAAEALVTSMPHDRSLLYLIAANQRCLNRIGEALGTLQKLEEEHPQFSLLYQERGHCYTSLRDAPRAIDAFQRAVSLNPALTASWSMLERLSHITGDVKNAELAAEQLSILKQLPSEIVRAGSLFSDGELSAAEDILRAYLLKVGSHSEALRLLGRIQAQRGVLDEAEALLGAAFKAAPDYRAARVDYVRILIDRQKYPQAYELSNSLLQLESTNRHYVSLHAAACVGLGRHEQAIALYRELLASSPSAELHLALGHSVKSLGRQGETIDCYKAALDIRPSFGDAHWSLANLKTYRFSDAEIASMREEEAAPDIAAVDRYHLCFALGKAYEDRSEYAESWKFYERGNRLKRGECHYSPDTAETNARKQIELCTAEFFAARAGGGAPDPDPIFVVGLPRSGSTLVEQILASHSQVEGTQELYDLQRTALGIRVSRPGHGDIRYPEAIAELGPEEFRRLGEQYLADTRPYRTDKRLFIDKMPNNFRHIGLIHLMLPNAKIIDVRREPMACCFSNLKQLFATGQEFTYGSEDIARYYRVYLDVMHHWNAVLPGRVLRILYEDLVEDLQGNVRSILEYCGLEFEAECEEFYKTERSVRTPSSEQVRQPIFRASISQWRNYEPWLGPLKDALGGALSRYRE